MVRSEALKNLDQEAWKKLGLAVYASCVVLASKAPHALHLYVEMHHSCGLCNDVYTGQAGSDLQLFDDMEVGYHM
ncbi:hypothetical protein GBA52_026723 [Prunus armeniaca]|nr:hypothetical protein GBA52_026723 [Prunus armeniaca]